MSLHELSYFLTLAAEDPVLRTCRARVLQLQPWRLGMDGVITQDDGVRAQPFDLCITLVRHIVRLL